MLPNLTYKDIETAKESVFSFAEKVNTEKDNKKILEGIHDIMSLLRNYYVREAKLVDYKTFAQLADDFTGKSLRTKFPAYATACIAHSNNLLKI